jgi:hypothetical protein
MKHSRIPFRQKFASTIRNSVFVVLATALSCSDENSIVTKEQADKIPINTAKEQYQTELTNTNSTTTNARQKPKRSQLIKNADWANASYKNLPSGNVLVVPTKFNSELYFKPNSKKNKLPISSLTHLLFYRDKTKRLQMEVITVLPSYLASVTSFNGELIAENWNGDFLRGYSFRDGEVFPLATSAPTKKNGRFGLQCTTTNWFTCYDSEFASGCAFDYAEEICEVTWEDDLINNPYSGGGVGGGSGGSSASGGGNATNYGTLAGEFTPAVLDDSQNKLCGSYTFTNTGDGLTAEIITLSAPAFHRPSGQHIPHIWGSACLTFGSSTGLTNSKDASIVFNKAWGITTDEVEVWLNKEDKAPLSVDYSNVFKATLIANLKEITKGAIWFSTGPCSMPGTVPSLTQYCN